MPALSTETRAGSTAQLLNCSTAQLLNESGRRAGEDGGEVAGGLVRRRGGEDLERRAGAVARDPGPFRGAVGQAGAPRGGPAGGGGAGGGPELAGQDHGVGAGPLRGPREDAPRVRGAPA